MPRSSLVLGVLLLWNVGAGGANSPSLGDQWYPDGTRFTGLMPPPEVIELKHGVLTWNGVAIRNDDVVLNLKQMVQLKPRPRVYLYFTTSDYAAAQLLAAQIRDAGGCDGGGCLFKVTEG